MKTVFKNFWALLRRNPAVSILNLLGLSAAFVAFMLIFMQVNFEFGYERFRSAADRIYRVETQGMWGGTAYSPNISRFNGETIGQLSPRIEESGLLYVAWNGNVKFTYDNPEGELATAHHDFFYCTPSWPSTMQFEIVEGKSAPDDLSQILIPQSLARSLFGRESALGRRIEIQGEFVNKTSQREFYVCGVYRDIPANSMEKNAIYANVGDTEYQAGQEGWVNHFLYVRLHSPQDKEEVETLINGADLSGFSHREEQPHMRLQLLTDIYFANRGNFSMTMIFVSIALLVLVIALINFFNFSIALSPMRIQSLNMFKILGSKSSSLRRGLLAESVLFCLLAYSLALYGLYAVQSTSLMSYLQADMTLGGNLPLLGWGALIAAGVGLVAGLYPAVYTTSVPTALTLKGSFGLSFRGRRLRTALIGVQYVVSIVLLIAAVFMNLQYRLIRQQDLGLDTDQVVAVRMSGKLAGQRQTLVSLLQQNPTIVETAFCHQSIVDRGASRWGMDDKEGNKLMVDYRLVDPEFISLMDIRLSEGRNFMAADSMKQDPMPIIVNRTFQQTNDLHLGELINDNHLEVVGVVEDFTFRSLHSAVGPFMFMPLKPGGGSMIYLKINTSDYPSAIAFLTKTAKSLDPDFEGEPYFLNAHIDKLYKTDSQNIALVSFFSLLAILISLSGVFSLVAFETRHKRKEIGVRRVFGATVAEILRMLNRTYVKVVAVCFVLAVPLAVYGLQKWLESYTVKVPLSGWVFAGVLLVVWGLTALTVTWMSYRTATENPVRALRSE